MFLESAAKIKEAIESLTASHLDSSAIKFAVAYWGQGAEDLLRVDRRYVIVCNLSSGGTNPFVIRKIRDMKNVDLKQHDRLHAKVCIFSTGSLITSANFSTNGLWLEGEDTAGLEEAGWQTTADDDDYVRALMWFDRLRTCARPISDGDITRAEKTWDSRKSSVQQIPPLNSLFLPEETMRPSGGRQLFAFTEGWLAVSGMFDGKEMTRREVRIIAGETMLNYHIKKRNLELGSGGGITLTAEGMRHFRSRGGSAKSRIQYQMDVADWIEFFTAGIARGCCENIRPSNRLKLDR